MTSNVTPPIRLQLIPEDFSTSWKWLYFLSGRDTWEISLTGGHRRNTFFDVLFGKVRCGPEDMIDKSIKVTIPRGEEVVTIEVQ